ncbi:MAG: helix-turn-helix domain-containing protein [Acidithiobacillus sp.]
MWFYTGNRSLLEQFRPNTGQGVRASNEGKRATARLLRAQGQSYRTIATELGVDYRTAWNWCNDD